MLQGPVLSMVSSDMLAKIPLVAVLTSPLLIDKYIESQLILASHDRLAQYWVGFGHISFFERVNIDDFVTV